jgi:Ca-activated chloride channel family protein
VGSRGDRRRRARTLAGALLVVACAALTLAAAPADPPSPRANPFADLAPSERPPTMRRALLVVLDASGSMRGDDGSGSAKIDTAKRVLDEVLEDLPRDVGAGLRVYGHRAPNTDRRQGCADSELLVPVAPRQGDRLTAAVDGIQARGFTPIALSLQQAARELPPPAPQIRDRAIVLISDGVDSCGPPDPCSAARAIEAEAEDIRINTIGFRVNAAARTELQCVARVTGGEYFDVDDEKDLFAAFRLYELRGEPVQGGDTPSAALPLESGQYLDTVRLGQERWYRVEVGDGDSLRAAATLVPQEEGLRDAGARFSMRMHGSDVLGSLHCEEDVVDGVGFGLTHAAVRWDRASDDAGLCAGAGTRLLRLDLAQAEVGPFQQRSPLEDQELDVELLVAVEPERQP